MKRIQLGTYNAYCITPFFTSWLGNGTSRLTLPVMLSGGGIPTPSGTFVGVTAVADLGEEDDIAAIDR